MTQMDARPALEEIPIEECLRLLVAFGVGRFAVALPDKPPLVVPVNYVVDGEVIVVRSGAHEATRDEVAHLRLSPWVGEREHWIRLVPAEITGRRITLPEVVLDPRGYL